MTGGDNSIEILLPLQPIIQLFQWKASLAKRSLFHSYKQIQALFLQKGKWKKKPQWQHRKTREWPWHEHILFFRNTKTFFRGSKHKFSKMSSLTKSNVKFLDKPIISMALKAQMWEDFNVPIMASSLRLKKVPFWRVKEHAHCHFGPCINITVITKPIQRSIFIIQFKRISPGG